MGTQAETVILAVHAFDMQITIHYHDTANINQLAGLSPQKQPVSTAQVSIYDSAVLASVLTNMSGCLMGSGMRWEQHL